MRCCECDNKLVETLEVRVDSVSVEVEDVGVFDGNCFAERVTVKIYTIYKCFTCNYSCEEIESF